MNWPRSWKSGNDCVATKLVANCWPPRPPEKIYSNDVELHISKEEGPGVTVATERDVPPDDAVLRSSVYEEGCATAAFSHID